MAVKRRVTKEEFNAFTGDNAYLQKLYTLQGDGSYKLDAEPDEDNANLIAAKQAEKDRADAAAAENAKFKSDIAALNTSITDLKAQLDDKKNDKNRKDGKFDEIEADLRGKLAEKDALIASNEEKNKQTIKKLLIDGAADTMATEIFTIGKEMAHKVKDRLDVDFSGDTPKLIVTKDGKATSSSLDDLRKELVAIPELKSIVKASNASGGGANGGNGGSGSTGKAFKDMSEAERTTLYRENPAEFRRLDALNKSGAAA